MHQIEVSELGKLQVSRVLRDLQFLNLADQGWKGLERTSKRDDVQNLSPARGLFLRCPATMTLCWQHRPSEGASRQSCCLFVADWTESKVSQPLLSPSSPDENGVPRACLLQPERVDSLVPVCGGGGRELHVHLCGASRSSWVASGLHQSCTEVSCLVIRTSLRIANWSNAVLNEQLAVVLVARC